METKLPKTPLKKMIWLAVETFIVVAAMNVSIRVVPWTGSEYSLAAVLEKISSSFCAAAGSTLFTAIAIFALFKLIDEKVPSCHWAITALAGVFAVMYVVALSFKELGESDFLFAGKYQFFLACFCIAGYWILFSRILSGALYFSCITGPENEFESKDWKRLWLYGFFIITLFRLPWIFASYPATMTVDGDYQLLEWFGRAEWTTHMPPFATALMGSIVSLGELIKDRTFGCFLFILFQTLSGAAVFSYGLTVMRKMGCGKKVYNFSLLFYALTPIWGAYTQKFEKDYLHTILLALCMIILLEVIWEKTCSVKQAILIGATGLAAMLMRNNTKYELIPLIFAVCLCIKGTDKKRLIASFAAVFLIIV